MALTNINGVEEVNIFKNDGTVIRIATPKSKELLSLFVKADNNMHFIYSPSIYTFEYICCNWIIRNQKA